MKCQCFPHLQLRNVLTIQLDGDCVAEIHKTIAGARFKVPEEMESEAHLQTWLSQQIASGAHRYALWRLSKAPMSKHKLRQTLKEKYVPEAICEEIIASCLRLGYLNDTAYAEALVERQKRSQRGSRAAQWACRKQGIDPKLAKTAYDASTTAEDERKAILDFARKRTGGGFSQKGQELSQNPKERQKLIAALMRRGFSYGAIREALQKNKE